jgi:hypothetical protein
MKANHGRRIQRDTYRSSDKVDATEIRTANVIGDRLQWEAYDYHYYQRFARNISIEDYLCIRSFLKSLGVTGLRLRRASLESSTFPARKLSPS